MKWAVSARLATDVAVEDADRPHRPRAAVRTVSVVLGDVSGHGVSEPRVAQAPEKCHGACPLMVRSILSGGRPPRRGGSSLPVSAGSNPPKCPPSFCRKRFRLHNINFQKEHGAVRPGGSGCRDKVAGAKGALRRRAGRSGEAPLMQETPRESRDLSVEGPTRRGRTSRISRPHRPTRTHDGALTVSASALHSHSVRSLRPSEAAP